MRMTKALRRLLQGYAAALAVLAALAVAVLLIGGSVASFLSGAVLFGLIVLMVVWLIVAYYAGASPSTYLRPDMSEMVLLLRDDRLILPQDNPQVMEDAKEKMVGSQSDVLVWAGANAVLCFGLGYLFYLSPFDAAVALGVAVAALGLLLGVAR